MTDRLVAGRYRLVQRLGAGGMSEVWAADDTELGRRVALKLLAPQADTERFQREARAVAALGHPNINQVFDCGEADGRPYMVLELLAGGSLADRLAADRPLPDDETRRIATDVASGLEHAHARGLVHRDLKPANVLFDSEGRAKIADFGIARLEADGTLTEAGTVLGTATTIAPEQAAGQQATPASDVYSFGVLLFWMLAGRPPFVGERPLELLQLHRNATPPALASLRPDVPADLEALAEATLAKEPAQRPADGGELRRRLGPTAAPTLPVGPPRRPRRSRRFGVGALVALLVAGLGAAGAAVAIAVVHDGGSTMNDSTSAVLSSLTLPTLSTAGTTAAPTQAQSTRPARETTVDATTSTRSVTTRPRLTTRTATTPPPPSVPVTTTEPPLDTTTVALTTTAPADATTTALPG